MILIRLTSLLVLGLLVPALSAQDLTHKAPPQGKPIAIINATVHTMSGETYENGHVVFEDGMITDVGPGDRVFSSEWDVLNAKGLHVWPGMIGAVTRLGLTEISSVRAMRDYSEVGNFTPEVRAAVSVNPDSTLIPVTRSNGILVSGVFPSGGRVPGRASVMQLDGWTWEDMALEPEAGLVINWPRARPVNAWWMTRSEEEQLKEIREARAQITDFFDLAKAYVAAKEADPDHPTDVRFEAMRDVLAGERPVFINANDVDQILDAVTWAADEGLEPVIVGGRDAVLAAPLLKKHDVPVILEGVHRFPKRDDSAYDDAFTAPSRLDEAGVRWCFASGEETAHERSLPYNAATAVAHGLDHDDAMRALTLWPAEVLGVADRLGSLEPGKHATLIITTGSPLDIRSEVLHAFIRGREINLTNKQTELDEKYREKYRQLEESSGGSSPR